ncbi:hypothetical protein ACFQJ7_12950 [Halovenus rubra]|uniref:Metallo-beta-lactamase superfamily protein n=2 Tax=Halovenus rubra TaxID=869890 RepID=A0ABD5XBJ7_9EURY|nr:hypothetical protein [Halovenus rubra]
MKASDSATDWKKIDRFDDGIGWIAYPDETMQRASHAITDGDDVWLVDPVDADGIDDLLAEYGEVAGVIILLDRHKRDTAALARRHDVSVWIPTFMESVAQEIDAPVERFRHDLADTRFAVHELINNRFWTEAVLHDPDSGSLVVPEAVGTTSYFRTHTEDLGVHPMLRMTPPRKLTRLEANSIRVGHGSGINKATTEQLHSAVDGARRRAPHLVYKNVKNMVFS